VQPSRLERNTPNPTHLHLPRVKQSPAESNGSELPEVLPIANHKAQGASLASQISQ
jgi:hypothetical protein